MLIFSFLLFSVALLMTWYSSMRTRYGKLVKMKSGDGATERTDRDRFIATHFAFLKNHIAIRKAHQLGVSNPIISPYSILPHHDKTS